jgi:RNA polymerase sigma factor (sigma-70 family)
MSEDTENTDWVGSTDEMLILACREDDSAAWEELVNRYQRLVYSIPRRSGFDEAVSSDVFQHVFATLLVKLDQIKDPSKVRAWLITTAKRETWRVSRQQTATVSIELDDQDESTMVLPDEKPLPDEVIQRLEEQQFVRIALAELGDPCRQLLDMLFYSPVPQSYDSIAMTLHMPIGSIGPTRVRCLQKLRNALAQMGY